MVARCPAEPSEDTPKDQPAGLRFTSATTSCNVVCGRCRFMMSSSGPWPTRVTGTRSVIGS